MAKKITLDDLAGMVARGFHEMDGRFHEMDGRFDKIDKRLDQHDRDLAAIRFTLTELA